LAAGADGQGKLPDDFWPTYSAFANTRGGVVILGLKENRCKGEGDSRFDLRDGIKDPQRIRGDLFNNLNNRKQVSVNILCDDDFSVASVDGKNLIIINIPQATRKQKPVYIYPDSAERRKKGDNGLPSGQSWIRIRA